MARLLHYGYPMPHWVIIMKPMGDEILVVGTREDVAALRPREMTAFPLAELLAGGWTESEIQTPAQVRASIQPKGPCFFWPEPPVTATHVNHLGQLVSEPLVGC